MKFGLYNYGTRGDLQPFIALAIGLKEKGHDVKLVCITPYPSDFSAYEREFGLTFEPVLTPDFYKNNPVSEYEQNKETQKIAQYYDSLFYSAHLGMRKLAQDSDVIIAAAGAFEVHGYAQKYGKKMVNLCLQYHLIPSSTRKPKYIKEDKSIEEAWRDIELHHAPQQAKINTFRSHIGLLPLSSAYKETAYSSVLNLVGISHVFCEKLKDGWDQTFKVCGYMNPPALESEQKIPDSLDEFLASGAPPAFFSMGSAAHFDENPLKRFKIVIDAMKVIGARVIVQCTDGEDISDLCLNNKNIYVISGVAEHRKIMPKCSVIIHHGGTGTTHAACLSGRPSIVLHYWGDMPDWAEDMKNIGVTCETIHAHELTCEWLVEQLNKILNNEAMLKTAMAVGKIMEKEQFISNAIKFLEDEFLTH